MKMPKIGWPRNRKKNNTPAAVLTAFPAAEALRSASMPRVNARKIGMLANGPMITKSEAADLRIFSSITRQSVWIFKSVPVV